MGNWSGKGSARNLSISISIRESDSDPATSRNLPLIYGSTNEPDFISEINTTVTYHAPKPTFHDVIKIKLPANVPEKLHLFFTIKHINVRQKSKKEKPSDIVVCINSIL